MELTKEQRHEVYELALSYLKLELFQHICPCIMRAVEILHGIRSDDLEIFSELLSLKPIGKGIKLSWWNLDKRGFNKRVKTLEKCIEMSA